MKVLVAGASGFIGSAVARALLAAGHEVTAVSRSRGAAPQATTFVAADVGAAPLDPERFEGIEAIVNLVGIASERGHNTFEAAHVGAVQHLLDLAEACGVDRFVHVSVVRPQSSEGGYHRSKRAGETLVRARGRRWTILRPGLVYGPGDAMLSNLVRFVTLAPVFVAPGGQRGPLQTVDVLDVAEAVLRTLDGPGTEGQTFDVVGPQRHTLPELVRTVAAALSLPTVVVPVPQPLMRAAAAAMERVLPNPPITPTQLGMLTGGLFGEVEHTREALSIEPRPLTPSRIREVAAGIEAPSVRLLPDRAAREEAERWQVPPLFVAVAIAALVLGPWLIAELWTRMLVLELGLLGGLAMLGAPLKSWMRPRRLGLGVAAAAVMLAGAVGVIEGLRLIAPAFMSTAGDVHAMATSRPLALTIVMLPIIAGAEDLVWRFGITLGLVRRLGPAGAVAAGGIAFALAHATTGPPSLALAALLAGLAWSALALRTRAWLPVVTCHVLWDAGVVLYL